MSSGVVAAGHPLTAAAGADVLRAGGNAVDAALAAMLTSFVAEPLLTGLGAGGYMLVVAPDGEPVLLDFFVEAPGRGADLPARAPLVAVDVSFGDVVQVFNIGAASCGRTARRPASARRPPASGRCRSPTSRRRRRRSRATVWRSTPSRRTCSRSSPRSTRRRAEARALFMPEGRVPREGDVMRDPELADSLERLGAEGAAPFY